MATEGKKRKRPVPSSSRRSKKRQRIEGNKNRILEHVKRLPVALDALSWKEVETLDMFEDAEGFYGLEEVEDVEVVRIGNGVQFIPTKARINCDEDEFEGFGDDENIEATEGPHSEVKTKSVESRVVKKKKTEKFVDAVDKDIGVPGKFAKNAFAGLEEDKMAEEVDVSAWEELDLSSNALSALAKLGFSNPTPIQRASIPEILAGRDVIGKAPTGSGKTLAFAIPILEKWLEENRGRDVLHVRETKMPIALVLSPTRELAHQLAEHLTALCARLLDSPFIATFTGGLSIQKQQRQLLKADIVVGTPGRLWEIMNSSTSVSTLFRKIKFLVIDEADRLLTEGQFKEAEEILNALDRRIDGGEDGSFQNIRQTLVFSATFQKSLQQKLAGKGKYGLDNNESMEYLLKKLNFREEKPKYIDVNPISQMVEELREGIVECAGTEKDLYLYTLLLYHPSQRILIFTNSIHSVRRLTPLLQNLNLPTQALHSQMLQKARLRAIERFSSSASSTASSILVATDVAARGLDIPAVQLVIHYHLPRTASTYVHRSGRTARAQASGSSILLCAPEEVVPTRRLVAKVHAQNAITAEANGAGRSSQLSKYYMRSLDLDRRIVARLKSRVTLAKRIADSMLAKEKKHHEDDWVRTAAMELGVDYDSDEFDKAGGGRKGRGAGRRAQERQARAMSKTEVALLKSELKALLAQRVNVGVSERYLTAGGNRVVDVNELLGGLKGSFLGKVDGIGLDD